MNFSRLSRDVLWIFPLLLQAAILFVLLRRRLLRRFPVFFAYTAAVVLRECILLFLIYPGKPYAEVYWSGEVVSITLGVSAIFEAFRNLCVARSFATAVFRLVWAISVFCSVAGAMILLPVATERVDVIILAERASRLIEACSLILVSLFVLQLGSGWRDYSVGIAAGFGVYSALSLAVFELCGRLHLVGVSTYIFLNSAAYNIAAIIWGIYFLRPQHECPPRRLPKTNLSDWKNAVTAYYTQQWHRQH